MSHRHSPSSPDRAAALDQLRRQLARHDAARPRADAEPISTGVAALDRLLPGGGLRPGSLVEYLAARAGSGAGTLAIAAACAACRGGRLCVVIDRERQFYPLSAAAWGFDPAHLLLLHPASEADALWAVDQALRCPGVGAVWAAWGPFDPRDFRRLQLAAESGGTVGLLLRSARVQGQPTWADVQWLIAPAPAGGPWRIHVTLLRARGGAGGGSALLELDDATGAWHEVSDHHATNPLPAPARLANPKAVPRRSRA